MHKYLSRNFSKEGMQIAIKYVQRSSTSLTTREMQIKTTIDATLCALGWLSWKTETTSGK